MFEKKTSIKCSLRQEIELNGILSSRTGVS